MNKKNLELNVLDALDKINTAVKDYQRLIDAYIEIEQELLNDELYEKSNSAYRTAVDMRLKSVRTKITCYNMTINDLIDVRHSLAYQRDIED